MIKFNKRTTKCISRDFSFGHVGCCFFIGHVRLVGHVGLLANNFVRAFSSSYSKRAHIYDGKIGNILRILIINRNIISPLQYILIWVFNKELNNYYFYHYDKLKKIFINEFKVKYSFILRDFRYNFTNLGLITALEKFILSLHVIVSPSRLNFLSIIFIAYLSYNEVLLEGELFTLSLEINTYICNILSSYIGFILCVDIVSFFIINGYKFKSKYPLVYNTILILSGIVLLILAFSICFYINKCLAHITSLILQNIEDFFIKMMVNPRPSGQPGGLGEPVGGGGKPPKNLGW